MQSIKDNVFIEDQYPGVTLGAIALPRGLMYIDAPPLPEHGRTWRADLLDVECGPERLLIHLDANIDRTLGARAMDCMVLAHEKTAEFFSTRPNTFKTQGSETGAVWEDIQGLSNIRWAPPEISFGTKTSIYWGDSPVVFEHHPGSAHSAIWVSLPEEKVVFIGDAVVKNQPPFFANADIALWIEALELLLSNKYQGYTVVSGRGGTCATVTIRKQIDFLRAVQKPMKMLGTRKAEPEKTEKMIPALLDLLRFPISSTDLFTRRLRYGLRNYYVHHYIPQEVVPTKKK